MPKIESNSFDVKNGNVSDVFSYFRDVYNTDDPSEGDYISIFASSTYPGTALNRSNVSTLISAPDGLRWLSRNETDAYFIIDFHSNQIDLIAYSIETAKRYRFINTWDLYGIEKNKTILIDRQVNVTLCEGAKSDGCFNTTITPFRCKHPGVFRKFKFVHKGVDSEGDSMLSMSKIRFYGSVNPHIPGLTHHLSTISIGRTLFFIVFLLSI